MRSNIIWRHAFALTQCEIQCIVSHHRISSTPCLLLWTRNTRGRRRRQIGQKIGLLSSKLDRNSERRRGRKRCSNIIFLSSMLKEIRILVVNEDARQSTLTVGKCPKEQKYCLNTWPTKWGRPRGGGGGGEIHVWWFWLEQEGKWESGWSIYTQQFDCHFRQCQEI